MNVIYHYPPELFNLLVDTIPLLCRSKRDVLLFFRGSGVDSRLMVDVQDRVVKNPQQINKYEIVRSVLTKLNENGENTLRQRREVLKRVVEFETFESCWENDRLKAKGLVAEIRHVVKVKDSFTRMKIEKEKEESKIRNEYLLKAEKKKQFEQEIESIRLELSNLFHMSNPQKRGKLLESLLNRLFLVNGILIREDFTLKGDEKEGIVEQLDGVIELDNNIYLVEMKWWEKPIGNAEVSQHLVRLFNRGQSRGIFISVSGYTEPAIRICRDSLSQCVIVLCNLYEIIHVLENKEDLKPLLKEKIQSAIIDKNPYFTR
ncbi:restriction endonuclease [Peribacillus sp. NPDC101481]|uniref:restriction endonuclease n=1 Tax=Peribacillus sp. NPDC101481 TaxID=3364403 RepID=UPI00382FF593